MATTMKQVIEDVKYLTANERTLIAHCLISSLDTYNDDEVDATWADLAEKRYAELISGEKQAVSWDEIKNAIRG